MQEPLVDLAALDLSRDVVPEERLRACLPHRHEFQLLDGICHLDAERRIAVGYKDWGADAWWAKGHIPGRPLLPGVLMIEGGAQIATFLVKQDRAWMTSQMIGLAGLDDVRLRGTVVPPARVYFVAGRLQISGQRLARVVTQVFCNGQMTLEMKVMGVML